MEMRLQKYAVSGEAGAGEGMHACFEQHNEQANYANNE
jgi:hypothetical protein